MARLSFPHILGLQIVAVGIAVIVGIAAFTGATGSSPAAGPPQAPDGMAYIPAGTYEQLYASPGDDREVQVEAFFLDTHPITNAKFLAFVEANPEWQRSNVRRLFADESYLRHWSGDLDFGPDSLAHRPVAHVSWFAAQAYARWLDRRIPTTAEWELAALAGQHSAYGPDEPGYYERILQWYSSTRGTVLPPVGQTPANYYGVHDLHGLIWEWVDDFNTTFVTGDSRNDGALDTGLFCGSGSAGAEDFADYAAFIRFAFRNGIDGPYTAGHLGFRTALDAASPSLTSSNR